MDGRDRIDPDAVDTRSGWVIVAVGFLALVVLWGAVFTFTVYAADLAAAFGLSGLQTSAVFSVGTAAFFGVGGTVGILVARVPLRPVVGGAALVVAASTVLMQVVDGFVGLAVAFGLLGVAGGTTFVLTVAIVPQWFERHRGTATGLTVAGNGLGVQVLPFVWLPLIEGGSIRQAFLVVGLAGVVVLVAAMAVYRRPPGLRGGGDAAVDRRWLRTYVGSRRFQAAFVGLMLTWAWYLVLSSGLVDILTANGIARSVAATAFGFIGGLSVVFRVGSGGIADRIGLRLTYTLGSVCSAVGLLVLAGTGSEAAMYVSLVAFGVGLGAVAALYPPIVVRGFGPANATAITGSFMYTSAISGFLAPVGVDVLAAATGGHTIPLVVLAGLTLLGTALFYWGTDPAAGG